MLLFEPRNNRFGFGITCTELAREPVSAALRYPLSIGDHFELADLARCPDGFNAQTIFDLGRETRNLGTVVLSSWAVNNLDSH